MARALWAYRAPKVCLLVFLAFITLPVLMAQAPASGQWTTLSYQMPINPVHVALLHTGKILVVSGSGNDPNNHNLKAALWDPKTGSITTQTVSWDMFCDGMVVLPDGRPFIMGGTLQYDPFYGEMHTTVYDPSSGLFTDKEKMAHGRWYPTGTLLGDGRVMIFSGLNETGGTNSAVEIYTVGSGWSSQYTASWTPPLYPRMHVLPDGTVFYSGPSTTSAIFDPVKHSWTTGVANTNYGNDRTYGSSVLLPLSAADNYIPKVMILGGGSPATATTEIIDLSQSHPRWQYSAPMSQGRIEMNAVMLPDGKILALGGSVNDEDGSSASLKAYLFDPATQTFSSAGTEAYARLYHSVALLLPDATVAVAGGNPSRGTYEPHIEIYKPSYLFAADPHGKMIAAKRPEIGRAPNSISYGSTFLIATPTAAVDVSSVVLIRPGSTTHAFDMDQRMIQLSFALDSNGLHAQAPPNGNIAPPGYYMLFLINNKGVPSVAQFVQLGTGFRRE